MPKDSAARFTMVPARRSDERTATKRARAIMRALLACALCGVLALAVSLLRSQGEVDLSEVEPEGRAIADAAAFQTLHRQQITVPVAESFDPQSALPTESAQGTVDLPFEAQQATWIDFDRNVFQVDEESEESVFEIHHYLLLPKKLPDEKESDKKEEGKDKEDPKDEEEKAPEDEDSESTPPASPSPDEEDEDSGGGVPTEIDGLQPMQLDVTILLTEDGPRLAAVPALVPWKGLTDRAKGEGDYSNYSNWQVDLPSAAQSQISRWATAYAANDQDALLSVTGDTDPNHSYHGLGGFKLADSGGAIQVLSTLQPQGDQLVVRVRLLLERDDKDLDEKTQPYRSYSDFDLLLSNPGSAQPPVVAWGAAGSAASLEPYGNAVNG